MAVAFAIAIPVISANGQTVIGPNPPIETAGGANWYSGSGGAAYVSLTDTNYLTGLPATGIFTNFFFGPARYDGMLSNSAASGSGSGNNANFRAGYFPLNGAKTVEISFYYYAPKVNSGNNIRVDLRMYQGANDVGFINDNNQHPFATGTMTGYAFYSSGPITVPAGANDADIWVSINTFGDDPWDSGAGYFGDFLVTTLTGPPFVSVQPFSDTVNLNSVFTNSIVASGPAPLSYQWYKNGAPVTDDLNDGTNNTLTLNSIQLRDASTNYYVVVKNSYGAVTSAVVSLTINTNLPAIQNTGLTWPASRYLPTFSTPAPRIDCIDMDIASSAEQALFASLEGIVNRTQPQLACVSTASEGEFTWLGIHNLSCDLIDGYDAILNHETNITGLVVTDPAQPDTLNLATTIAGIKSELICDPSLLKTLTNSPYNLSVNDDLRGKFSGADQVYNYLYNNYWSQCTHRIIAGLETNNDWYLRDYLVAVKSAVVWLDPNLSGDATALAQFVSQMTPAGGVYLGWWPNEGADMNWIGQYGIPVVASDYFDNGTIYAGVVTPISVPSLPPPPPLQNKIYVSLTLSDGDNVQYMQHAMYLNWQSSARGTVPIGWTVQPVAADFDPGMLNYFWGTATTNDCLVAGPSGAGYTHIEYWSSGNVVSYTEAANSYLQRSGIRTITIWDKVSTATGDAYATNCPTLVGINDQDDGYFTTHYESLAGIGFPSSGSYASTVSDLLYAITNTAANWNGSSPMFIPVQGVAWNVTPANCQTIANSLDPAKYIVVRPDQLFLLYQESVGMGKGGAQPFLSSPPASQLANPGADVTFSVVASGTSPLAYQWQFNGTNIPGATSASYNISNAQTPETGNYQVVVTNLSGSVTSSVATLTFGNQPAGLNGNGLNWTVSGTGYYVYSAPAIAGNLLTLTDGAGGETRSVFFDNPQYIGAFKASFTYQAGGNKAADGAAFCLQNDPRGASALGGGGGALGVGASSPITPSLELELNLYTGNNENVGYAVLTNGLTGANGGNGNYHSPGNVQLNSGDPINVAMNYANQQLTLTFTDAVAHTSFTTNLNVGNLAQDLGTNSAYVGFTGADGGASSVQTIAVFSFASMPPAAIESNGTNIFVSWPGSAPGFELQQNSSLVTANWVNVTNQSILSNSVNQIRAPENGSNLFFRLVLPLH
ncbi:MAG TPA: immunoglobulin domain-containing protein [Verrucomicrobiae bacterium]|nr:immunoglobulin domain-containing protein [Verrucomicrobiae bacterium]